MRLVNQRNSYRNASFTSLFKLRDLEAILLPYKGSQQYDDVIRYYFACSSLAHNPRLSEPLGLLRHTLQQIQGERRIKRSPQGSSAETELTDLQRITETVERYESRIRLSNELVSKAATEVPKTLHFVWLGGGLGAIQRDYLNVWKQIVGEHGYRLNLWYDSDALLAHQTTRLIVEAAKADALAQVTIQNVSGDRLASMYVERAAALKQQMYAHINDAVARGESADDARIELLVKAYGQDADELDALRERNRLSVQGIEGLHLRDLDAGALPMQLRDIYDREMRLRGNLAAASDVVRVEALYAESGSYSDVDNLPPLARKIGDISTEGLGQDERLGILQLLLNENPEWMPGRQLSSKYVPSIAAERLPAIQAFAQKKPGIVEIFQLPEDRLARPFMLRAVSDSNSINNAFMMAHAGSDTLQSVIDRIRFNYQLIDESVRLAAKDGVALTDYMTMSGYTNAVLEKNYGPLAELDVIENTMAVFLADAAADYFADGIRPQSQGTVFLTGPKAIRDGIHDFANANLIADVAQDLDDEVLITPYGTVNRSTEEELDHSWVEQSTNLESWLVVEQQRESNGTYKTRYKGDMEQLLRASAVAFEQGWPVIEGRPVLLTHVLEKMLDALGEPFSQALKRGHTGTIHFEKPLPLSFDDRLAIKAQAREISAPAFLDNAPSSHAAQSGIDDMLMDIAKGARSLVESTPLQRLSLGLLMGIESLDNQSFAAITGELDNLANNLANEGLAGRYAVIERQLFKRKSDAFRAGLRSEPPMDRVSHTLVLKKTALAEARTLQEWGRHVAGIHRAATLERRQLIAERSELVLSAFEESKNKLMAQDLLSPHDNEVAVGLCKPLTLLMSASLGQDDVAARQFRERFYMAAIEPHASDSVAFMQALQELRDVQISDVGRSLGRSDLQQIVSALEQHAGVRTLALNSDNHTMLVAKTVENQGVIYHFYDPNFGVFEFDDVAHFKRALEVFFLKIGMANHYAAYGTATQPAFDLIEMDSTKIAALSLSNNFKVQKIFETEPLPETLVRPLRQRLNSAHGKSLLENPQLGASLIELDGHWWGQQIATATVALQEQHELAKPMVPIFETLQITPEGKYQVSLIDRENPEHVIQVLSEDHRLLRIKIWLTEQFTALARRPAKPGMAIDPTEAGSVHTLNAGFTIQALMNALRGREGDDRPLSTAVRLHAFVNYAQLAHGNVVDIVSLVQLVRTALNEDRVIARTVAPVVGEALGHVANEGVGAVLGLANVGFDIYQLASAQDEVEKAQFGTQLAFDSASLALTAAGFGAALAGASTAAAVLGGGAVILGGLAIGVAALAQGFASIARDAQQVGKFFAELERAYRKAPLHFDEALNAWSWQPSLTLRRIDFNTQRVELETPKLLRLRDHFGVPDVDGDEAHALRLDRELKWPEVKMFAAPSSEQIVILPCTPETIYGYDYKALPFASSRHDEGFDIARRLEKKGKDGKYQFLFSFYSFPSHYIVYRLFPKYRETQITVELDAVERTLVVPVLPKAWHGKVNYRIVGAGESCSVTVNRGVNLLLESPSLKTCRWVLQGPNVLERDMRFVGHDLRIGGATVSFSGKGRHEVLIRLHGNELYRVDFAKRQLDILEQTAPESLDEQALLEHYKGLVTEHRLTLPYTPIHRYLIPFEDPQEPRYTTGWYDAHDDRFLYIRNSSVFGAEDAQLSLVSGDYAYFHNPKDLRIWQVEAATGLVKFQYRLLYRNGKTTIDSVEMDAHGVLHVVQQYVVGDQPPVQYRYMIHDGQVLLHAVTHDRAPELQALVSANEPLAAWATVLGDPIALHSVAVQDGMTTVDWEPAAYVSVCWKTEPKWRDMVWVRSADRLIIVPVPRPKHARGWDDAVKDLDELMLLPMTEDSHVFVLYERSVQRLCRLERSIAEGKTQWSHRWIAPPLLKQIVAVDNGYVLLDEQGLFYNLDRRGERRFGGVSEHWLKDRAQWWKTLEPLAERYPGSPLAIIGLLNLAGDGNLSAWYVDGQLLLSDPGPDKTVRLLGMTPDNQSAWLFDLSSGEIRTQPLIAVAQLDHAFGTGLQLLHRDSLPAYQQEWADWQFDDVHVDGTGLRATTVDGVILQLQHREAEVIYGVNRHWIDAQDAPLADALRALLEKWEHVEFVSVESAPDSLQWYSADSARLVEIAGSALPTDFAMLGTQGVGNVLLHERQDGWVRAYPKRRSLGQFDYVQRNAGVLVVEGHDVQKDLLPLIPDDVNSLILRLGQGAVTCHLSKATWRRLETVIVDCRHALEAAPTVPGKLIWDFDEPQKLLFEIVEQHLIIVDADSEHCLIFRDVCSADPALRGEVFLAFEKHRSHPVSTLVAQVKAKTARSGGVSLQALSPQTATVD